MERYHTHGRIEMAACFESRDVHGRGKLHTTSHEAVLHKIAAQQVARKGFECIDGMCSTYKRARASSDCLRMLVKEEIGAYPVTGVHSTIGMERAMPSRVQQIGRGGASYDVGPVSPTLSFARGNVPPTYYRCAKRSSAHPTPVRRFDRLPSTRQGSGLPFSCSSRRDIKKGTRRKERPTVQYRMLWERPIV
ncbi:hypothetical protein BC628DRAFT_920838 [Trametes gibbosa]|nr:hypothetical protein BC628DRAFT_920838 [Trametes gibbosa]